MLEYIRKHVTKWPEGALNVRLDSDGEICFGGLTSEFDFHPNDHFDGELILSEGCSCVGIEYTREQWETDLTKLDKPFGELDRATQLKLVEHVLDGGGVEVKFKTINQYHLSGVQHGIRFNPINTYRAIQS